VEAQYKDHRVYKANLADKEFKVSKVYKVQLGYKAK